MTNPLTPPLLYLITDRQQYFPHPHLQIEAIKRTAQALPPSHLLIQIREKNLSARALCEFVRAAMNAAQPYGARVLVNDRLDVALAVGADGVHLRTSSLPAAQIRRLVQREDFLIGVSTHSRVEALAAQEGGADFIVCGPVFPTPSKAGFGPPMGLESLAEICREISLPVLALGGIATENLHLPLACGAAGLAAIRLFNDPAALGSIINIVLSSLSSPQD